MTPLRRSGKFRPEVLVDSILASIDFSNVTDAVVKTATDLARAFKAKLV